MNLTSSHPQPDHLASRASTRRRSRPRLRRGIRAAGLATALVTGSVLALGATGASAQTPEMAVNELAPEITSSADRALVAYDEYVASGDLADYLQYASERAATARFAARQLGYNEFSMIDAWQATPLEHQHAVLAAMSQVGVPYRSHSSKEDVGFDCSGLTSYAWRTAGKDLARQSGSQIKAAERLTRDDAKAGDLVYYPGHVMMYLGVGDAVIHSVQTGRTVEVDLISGRRRNSVRWGDPTV
jgi:hypothetical protein